MKNKFDLRSRKDPLSRNSGEVVLILLLLLVVVVLLALALPHLTRARFTGHMDATVQVRVIDQTTGAPVASTVWLDTQAGIQIGKGTTNTNGVHSFSRAFRAQGVANGPAKMWIKNDILHVEADGYQPWKASLKDLHGAEIDYVKTRPIHTCEAKLEKKP